jgi:uncharacterized protein (TIGR02284 family)
MDNDKVVSVLNNVIETCIDGDQGFRDCANNISDPQLKTFFTERANSCQVAAKQLQELVVSLGGRVETSGSVSGAMHRRWVDIKSLITGKSDTAILDECERGEDVAVRSYRNALDQSLPEHVRMILQRQYEGVLKNHNDVKRLREQAHAQHDAH